MEKRRLILVGNQVAEDWEFQKGMEEATGKKWDVKVCVINRFDGLRKFTRYFMFFLSPLHVFFTRNRFEKIVSWEQFLGLILVFYCRLFHVKRYPEITVMALIYKPKKGVIGRIFAWFVRYTVSSEYIKKIVVYSESEIDYYAKLFGVPRALFCAQSLGIADRPDLAVSSDVSEKYYVAAGRSNRDYAFLRAAWPKDREKLYIVCDVEKSEDTGNIVYKKNCHGDEYLRLLSGAYGSIVPLESEKISSGQLVFLQSAMLSVPVITTKNDTVSAYVENNATGYIIEKTSAALEEALNKLDHPVVYRQMQQNVRQLYEARFSLLELGKRVGMTVR